MKQRRNTNISQIVSLQRGFFYLCFWSFQFYFSTRKQTMVYMAFEGHIPFPALLGDTGRVISAQELMALLSHCLPACILRSAFPKLHQPMVYTRQHHTLLSLWAPVITSECPMPVRSIGAGSTSQGLVWLAGSAGVASRVSWCGQWGGLAPMGWCFGAGALDGRMNT